MEDTESTTSVDDRTEDYADSPTRDALAEGLVGLLKPAIDQLDERVKSTRISQMELRQQIDSLAEDLRKISENQQLPFELDGYVKKLMNSKRRVMLVSNILQNSQERLNRIHQNVTRETQRRKVLLEPSTSTTNPDMTNIIALSSSVFSNSSCNFPKKGVREDPYSFDELTVEKASQILQAGDVIAIPTDTIYGVAALAQSTEAVEKLYQIKGRDCKKPVAICVGDIPEIYKWCKVTVSGVILEMLLPGPVTLVFERNDELNPKLNPQTKLVGIRIPDYPFVRALALHCKKPFALTSANVSDQPSALSVHEFKELWPKLGLIVDGGLLNSKDETCRLGSTVVDLSKRDYFSFIRPGCAMKNTRAVLLSYGLEETTRNGFTNE